MRPLAASVAVAGLLYLPVHSSPAHAEDRDFHPRTRAVIHRRVQRRRRRGNEFRRQRRIGRWVGSLRMSLRNADERRASQCECQKNLPPRAHGSTPVSRAGIVPVSYAGCKLPGD